MITGFEYPAEFLPVEVALNESRIPGLMTDFEWENYKYQQYKKWLEEKTCSTRLQDSNDLQSSIPSSKETDSQSIPLSRLRKKRETISEGYVTERRAGKYLERKVRKFQSSGGHIVRLKYERLWEGEPVLKPYVRTEDLKVDYDTGEVYYEYGDIRFCKESTSRMNDPKQVRRTCESFKWLVRANERHIRLFVTLTYAENMTDTKRLYQDYRKFVQKLRYQYPDVSGYLVAFEPQKRGAWHAHILIISENPFLRIPNKRMAEIWGHGFTKTQGVKKIRDIGCYLTSYLNNLKEGKKTKKGERLKMYPKGFHFLRSSQKGVSRTQVSRWFGRFDEVSYPGEIELIYDYEHCKQINKQGDCQVTKIFCFREKDSPGGCGVGEV